MVRHVEFILVSALLICPFGTVAQECSRYSPEEIWFADYSPWLHKTVEGIQLYQLLSPSKLFLKKLKKNF